MQREDKLSSRRLDKQPVSRQRRRPALSSDQLVFPVRTERLGWAKIEEVAR